MKTDTINIYVGDKKFVATLCDNSSAAALKQLLAESDIVVDMEDYAGMEKVGALGKSLPRNDQSITTSAGDLILYQGRYFVIYYARNSWSLTQLGRIANTTQAELIEALGKGDVSVRLSSK